MVDKKELRKYLDETLGSLYSERAGFFLHWGELAKYILPRRYKFLTTPNQQKGGEINNFILNATGTYAARTLAAGMLSGICSPAKQWFKLGIAGRTFDPNSPEQIWLHECRARMMLILHGSNFYTSMGSLFLDLVIFGTAVCIIYEDKDDVIRCYIPSPGEYFLVTDSHNRPQGLYREFTLTAKQVVDEFGEENCSPQVLNLYRNNSSRSFEVKIVHSIEPNQSKFGIPTMFKWAECFWEQGSNREYILRRRGYHDQAFMAPRWDINGNESYGRSVAMDALPDIKQLQQETKRKQQGIDKLVTPPILADLAMRNQPGSMLPGAVTYVPGLSNGTVGLKPAYQINLPLQEMREDITAIEARILKANFNDLFLTVTNLDTVRSAAEIDARRAEQLIMLGPVLERFDNEALTPIIERVFNIMHRAGLLPPAPPSIQGVAIQIRFESMLSESQRATSAAGIERWLGLGGNLVAVDPEALDGIDRDKSLAMYGSYMNVPPPLIRTEEQIQEIREKRRQEQQQAQLLEQTLPAVKGAQVLSETQVGGGNSALGSMLGGFTGA